MRIFLVIVLMLFSRSVLAQTGSLSISVMDQKQKTLHQAVVSIRPLGNQNVQGYQKYDTVMEQKDTLFSPFILGLKKEPRLIFQTAIISAIMSIHFLKQNHLN